MEEIEIEKFLGAGIDNQSVRVSYFGNIPRMRDQFNAFNHMEEVGLRGTFCYGFVNNLHVGNIRGYFFDVSKLTNCIKRGICYYIVISPENSCNGKTAYYFGINEEGKFVETEMPSERRSER